MFSIYDETGDKISLYQHSRQKEEIAEINACQKAMEVFKPLSKSEVNWLQTEVLKKYIFYNDKTAYCSNCNNDIDRKVITPHHNDIGICPICHEKITFHSMRKKTDFLVTGVGIIPCYINKNIFALRWVNVKARYIQGKKLIKAMPEIDEVQRSIYHPDMDEEWYEFYLSDTTHGWIHAVEKKHGYGYSSVYRTERILYSEAVSKIMVKKSIPFSKELNEIHKFYHRDRYGYINPYAPNWIIQTIKLPVGTELYKLEAYELLCFVAMRLGYMKKSLDAWEALGLSKDQWQELKKNPTLEKYKEMKEKRRDYHVKIKIK